MSFTDDDLKRLKEIISVNCHAQINASIFDHKFLNNFVVRLEAAEANMGGHSAKCEESLYCLCSKKDREDAWRRAKGL